MTRETGEFSYPEVVAWLMLLSSVSKCQGMALRAEEYANRPVVEGEMDQGRYWLKVAQSAEGILADVHEGGGL